MNNFFDRIDPTEFTDTDYGIMNFIVDNFKTVSTISLHELAKQLYTSEATIVRFCQKAGFSGFNELKFTIKTQQFKLVQPTNFRDQIELKTTELKQFLHNISTDNMQQIVDLLSSKKSLYLHGRSLSSIPVRYLHTVLNSLDRRCILVEDLHLISSISQTINSNAILLIISAGASYDVYEPIFKAAQRNHATTVLLSCNQHSRLTTLADFTLFSDDKFITYHGTDVNSRIHLLTLVQLLIESVSKRLV
uniref:MurR/RpiR family transcriptional regulator n=1 Tax=Tetragenococcus halophilus TaxID=51669 RepID=UPI0024E05482|nr:MurR/RpiR family transcriptional regulator [Tetragenococcus halophilus]